MGKSNKKKVRPAKGHESPQRQYSSTLSLTSALIKPRPGRLTFGKGTRYPLCRSLDGYGNSRPHRDSISGQSRPEQVAIGG